MSEKRVLTDQEKDYLKSLLNNRFITYPQIIENFNANYPNKKFSSRSSFLGYLKRENMYRGWQPCYKQFKNQEEMDYATQLMENKSLTWKQIGIQFWTKYRNGKMPKRFPKNLQETMTKTHKIRRPEELTNNGRFTTERNRTRMKIGSEVEKTDDRGISYTWVKVQDIRGKNQNERNKIYRTNWRPKHDIIWEQYHKEKLKKNEIVIFLDGNTHNYSIDNLRKIDRSINLSLANYRIHNNGIITLAMIETLETLQLVNKQSI